MKRILAIVLLALATAALIGAMPPEEITLTAPVSLVASLPAPTPTTPPVMAMAYLRADTEPAPDYDRADAELIARVLWSECRGEPREGWQMVAQCILDRLATGEWGYTVESVVRWPNQFAGPGELTDELLEVAIAVLTGERFSDDTILYFRATKSTKAWFAGYLGHVGGHAYYGWGNEK